MPALLTLEILRSEAIAFAKEESKFPEPSLYGVTDGKAVGTYLEHKFQAYLQGNYKYVRGSSAKGIDFPDLDVDIKVTSIRQPQSSCPFKSARQKIYGLGYSLLVFVYDKHDDPKTQTGRLEMQHTIFVEKEYTADFQTTSGLRKLLETSANRDDILAFFEERVLPVDSIEAEKLADEVLRIPPHIGYLTISNALQWRLQYSRVIEQAGKVEGVLRLT
ncbi:MAG TPA: restriction endonuclease [Verrucomicrobiae bacterium]|nr:restriction endonuclease [Verrucomicrobiae bacterium]